MKQIDVLIAEDHRIVNEALANHVRQLPYVTNVRQAANGREAVRLSKENPPDVVLMDIQMPEMDGIDCSEVLLRRHPEVKIVALTAVENPKAVVKMIELGVQGYVLKNMELDELDQAISSVVENDFYQNKTIVDIMRHEIISNRNHEVITAEYRITERDKKILKLICAEKTTKEIADEVCLSPRTVEKIRNDLGKKLGVKGVVGLVRFAIKHGYDI